VVHHALCTSDCLHPCPTRKGYLDNGLAREWAGRTATARRLLEQQPQELPFGLPQPQRARQRQQPRQRHQPCRLPRGPPPPAPFNVRTPGRDSSGCTRRVTDPRVTDPRVQTRSRDQGLQTLISPGPGGAPPAQGCPRARRRWNHAPLFCASS
jgi:hypothetical protein